MIGETVEKYHILEEIGQGGMAVVYRAQDTKLEREVAIKILHPHLMRQAEAVQRFHREAVTVAKLHHPNIIEIYDYSGENSPYYFIATELIDGMTLSDFVGAFGSLPCELVACIARELCMALKHAHEQGIIHRDLKPENIMIRKDGKLKLMDFGIARALEVTSLTMTGSVLGSPAFMSPEHLSGKDIDFRSDLFSLGSILFFLSTGHFPFEGRNPHEVLKKVSDGDHLPPQQLAPSISNNFARLLDKLLQVDPKERFQKADDLCIALDEILKDAHIENPAQQVHALFKNPESYIEDFKASLVKLLQSRAEISEKRKPARAVQMYNRLLAMDPQNAHANAAIERLLAQSHRREQILAAVKIAIAGSLIALLVVVVWIQLNQSADLPIPKFEPGPMSLPPSMSIPNESEQNSRPEVESPHPVVVKQPEQSARKIDTPGNKRPTVPKKNSEVLNFTGSLQVVAQPWAEIYIDNEKVGTYPLDANKKYSLSAGEHEVRLVNPGFVPHTETVRIIEADQNVIIRTRLKNRPAYLNVRNNQNAIVFIDGKFRGRTPLEKPLAINWKEQKSTNEVLINLNKEGYETFTKKLTLQAGKTVDLDITLTERK